MLLSKGHFKFFKSCRKQKSYGLSKVVNLRVKVELAHIHTYYKTMAPIKLIKKHIFLHLMKTNAQKLVKLGTPMEKIMLNSTTTRKKQFDAFLGT
jgi:hypothetical protein